MSLLSNSELHVSADADTVAQHAATWLANILGRSHAPDLSVCLCGGNSPRPLYAALAAAPHVTAMPWSRIHWYWGDERFVHPTDPRSNFLMANTLLLGPAHVADDHVHPVPTVGVTLDAAAAAYEADLQRFYGGASLSSQRTLFTVTFLGVGEDGHIASLFPGSDVLDERTHWAAPVRQVSGVPRVTLTYPALESSNALVLLVTGAGKRAIMDAICFGAIDLPVLRLRPHGRVYWFLDRAAAPAALARHDAR